MNLEIMLLMSTGASAIILVVLLLFAGLSRHGKPKKDYLSRELSDLKDEVSDKD